MPVLDVVMECTPLRHSLNTQGIVFPNQSISPGLCGCSGMKLFHVHNFGIGRKWHGHTFGAHDLCCYSIHKIRAGHNFCKANQFANFVPIVKNCMHQIKKLFGCGAESPVGNSIVYIGQVVRIQKFFCSVWQGLQYHANFYNPKISQHLDV